MPGCTSVAHNASAQRAFEREALPLNKWLLLLHYWSREFPAKDAADDADIHKNTACDVYRRLREAHLRHRMAALQLEQLCVLASSLLDLSHAIRL